MIKIQKFKFLVIAGSTLVAASAYAQLSAGAFEGTDNHKNGCQIKIQETETAERYQATISYVGDAFSLAPVEKTTKKKSSNKKGEYSAKILKEGTTDPSSIKSVKYTLTVQADDSGKPMRFFFFDNTGDHKEHKRRQFECKLN